jgi:large subunit ribosomal protein L22
MAVRAILKAQGLSPKRLRPLVNGVRGKNAQDILNSLRLMPGPAASCIAGAIRSAIANAENNMSMASNRLKIVRALVDGGPMVKRMRARARGRGNTILRRSSHITIEVEEV